jgi:hypothetical protein
LERAFDLAVNRDAAGETTGVDDGEPSVPAGMDVDEDTVEDSNPEEGDADADADADADGDGKAKAKATKGTWRVLRFYDSMARSSSCARRAFRIVSFQRRQELEASAYHDPEVAGYVVAI